MGALVFLSMKQDINPYITAELKPILLFLINDYDMEKESKFIDVFEKIKKKLDLILNTTSKEIKN